MQRQSPISSIWDQAMDRISGIAHALRLSSPIPEGFRQCTFYPSLPGLS